MTSLSHEQAREFVQQNHLAEEDRLALREHLTACDECRAYAAAHVHLWRQLPLRVSRATPTSAQRAAILDAADGRRAAPRLWRPLSAAGSVAAVLFLALGFWLVLRAASPVASQPTLPAPFATLLAPFLPQPAPMPVATPDPRGRYVIDTVPAPSLAGNVIGEPLEQQVAVYLPPSYNGSSRRYPVVYALFYGASNETNPFADTGPLARSGMNLALRGELAQEMILVIPNSWNALNLPNYFANSPVIGDWESFLAHDLVDYIDTHYRTLPETGSRGLLGEAHTALAALSTATRYPDVFSAVYLSNPWALPPGSLEQSGVASPISRSYILDLLDEVSTLSPEAVAGTIRDRFAYANQWPVVAWWTIGYGVAYAPTVGAVAPYFEYPYVDTNGPPDPEIWRTWESGLGDIPEKLQARLDALQRLNIALSHPEGLVEPALIAAEGPIYLSGQLTAAGIPHVFHTLDKSMLEELGEDALPFFSEVLTSE